MIESSAITIKYDTGDIGFLFSPDGVVRGVMRILLLGFRSRPGCPFGCPQITCLARMVFFWLQSAFPFPGTEEVGRGFAVVMVFDDVVFLFGEPRLCHKYPR